MLTRLSRIQYSKKRLFCHHNIDATSYATKRDLLAYTVLLPAKLSDIVLHMGKPTLNDLRRTIASALHKQHVRIDYLAPQGHDQGLMNPAGFMLD